MNTLTIILLIYAFFFAVCVVLAVQSRIQKQQGFREKIGEDIFFCFLAALFFPVVIYFAGDAIYYRNRPRPVPKKMRKWIKKDRVVFKGETMSLAQYNATHKKKYTLEQVYGKRYVASITPEEEADFDSFENAISIEDDLPDDEITTVAILMAKALYDEDLHYVYSILAEDVQMISYGRRMTIVGKDGFVDYWRGVWSKLKASGQPIEIGVKKNAFYGHAVVGFKQRSVEEHYIFFRVESGVIKTAVLTPRQQQPIMVRYYDLDIPRIDYKTIIKNRGEAIEPEANRMPCLICGALSDKLEWYRLEVDSGPFAHIGQVSVCPHCKAQAEFYPEIFLRKG